MYDLRTEPWIPYRRRSGAVVYGSPALLTDGIHDDPIVGFALMRGRADFEGGLTEFLLGLYALALAPEDETAWRTLWDVPPAPTALAAALGALPNAFDLEGPTGRFLQDRRASDFADEDTLVSVGALLLEQEGASVVALDTHPFLRRQGVRRVSRATAALALMTHQAYASSGGLGYRTGMRGGGPLTTLVVPETLDANGIRQPEAPLWYRVWANVETVQQLRAAAGAAAGATANTAGGTDAPRSSSEIYPWLRPTCTSEQGETVEPRDMHPAHAYFGMPRRLRLEFGGPGTCDLSGLPDEVTVIGVRRRNYGMNYSAAWRHPLTPYQRVDKSAKPAEGVAGSAGPVDGGEAGAVWSPIKVQDEGVSWRDVATMCCGTLDGRRIPARAVQHFLAERAPRLSGFVFSIRGYGFNNDNIKVRSWADTTVPIPSALYDVQDTGRRDATVRFVQGASAATRVLEKVLIDAVIQAQFRLPAEGKKSSHRHLSRAVCLAAEDAFYSGLAALEAGAPVVVTLAAFGRRVERAMTALFHQHAPFLPAAPIRHAEAMNGLRWVLRGYGPLGGLYFDALGRPRPAKKSSKAERTDNASSARTRAPAGDTPNVTSARAAGRRTKKTPRTATRTDAGPSDSSPFTVQPDDRSDV